MARDLFNPKLKAQAQWLGSQILQTFAGSTRPKRNKGETPSTRNTLNLLPKPEIARDIVIE
jgi:hypothetical protein